MNKKTYKQLEMETYVEHGVAKLRYNEPLSNKIFLEKAQELTQELITASHTYWLFKGLFFLDLVNAIVYLQAKRLN